MWPVPDHILILNFIPYIYLTFKEIKLMYIYSFYIKNETTVELQIQGPDYVVLTEILKLTNLKETGIIGTCILGSTVQLYLIKQKECWMFGLGQLNGKIGIPGNWVISLQQDYKSRCSSVLKISSNSPIIVKKPNDRRTSLDLPKICRTG